MNTNKYIDSIIKSRSKSPIKSVKRPSKYTYYNQSISMSLQYKQNKLTSFIALIEHKLVSNYSFTFTLLQYVTKLQKLKESQIVHTNHRRVCRRYLKKWSRAVINKHKVNNISPIQHQHNCSPIRLSQNSSQTKQQLVSSIQAAPYKHAVRNLAELIQNNYKQNQLLFFKGFKHSINKQRKVFFYWFIYTKNQRRMRKRFAKAMVKIRIALLRQVLRRLCK